MKLRIRNTGLAIFTELHIKQKPKILDDCFVFDSDISISELQYLYANSDVQRVFELNIAYHAEKRRLSNLK